MFCLQTQRRILFGQKSNNCGGERFTLFILHLRSLRKVHLDLWIRDVVKPIWILLLLYLFIQRRECSKVKSSTAARSVSCVIKYFYRTSCNNYLDIFGQIFIVYWSQPQLPTRFIPLPHEGDKQKSNSKISSQHSHIFFIPRYKYKHIFRLNRRHYEPHMQTESHWSQNMTSLSAHLSVKTLIITALPTYHLDQDPRTWRKEFIGSRKYFCGGLLLQSFLINLHFCTQSFLAPCCRTPISFRRKQLFHSKLFE